MGRRGVRCAAERAAGAALPAGRAPRGRGGGRDLSPNRAPDRLPGLVDSHCHLQDPAFDHDREAVIERARAAGLERLLVPGYDLESSRAAVALARTHPTTIQAAVGIHPHFASSLTAEAWEELAALAAGDEVVAVGEIGLDFYRNLSPPEAQRTAFARQLGLAATLGKPVLVHDRDAHAAIREALLAHRSSDGAARIRGVLHAFSGDAEMASDLAAAGYLISFAMPVAFRSAAGPRAAARTIPAGTFLTETDSPWLAPGGKGQRNEPTTALRVASELVRLRGVSPREITAEVRGAYDRLIGR